MQCVIDREQLRVSLFFNTMCGVHITRWFKHRLEICIDYE